MPEINKECKHEFDAVMCYKCGYKMSIDIQCFKCKDTGVVNKNAPLNVYVCDCDAGKLWKVTSHYDLMSRDSMCRRVEEQQKKIAELEEALKSKPHGLLQQKYVIRVKELESELEVCREANTQKKKRIQELEAKLKHDETFWKIKFEDDGAKIKDLEEEVKRYDKACVKALNDRDTYKARAESYRMALEEIACFGQGSTWKAPKIANSVIKD